MGDDTTAMDGRTQPTRESVLATDRVHVIDDPLAQVHLGRLRDRATQSPEFGQVGELLAAHTLWSALSDLHLRQDTVAAFDGSPISVARPAERIAGVVILRAGMLFSRPFQALLPHAPLYQVGIRRDEETLTPAVYTSNVPQAPGWADRVLVLDPMVATGGSTARAIAEVRRSFQGPIDVVALVTAPLGAERVLSDDADVRIVTTALDIKLNDMGYILPGLGDAGDRLFGT